MNVDLMKIFQVQEPSVRPTGILFPKIIENETVEKLREELNEKDVIIKNNSEKIDELQNQIADLEMSNTSIKNCLDAENKKNLEIANILKNYEKIISTTLQQREAVTQERDVAQVHLANLEFAFHDLLQKYERAKTVVEGFQRNEKLLLDHIKSLEEALKKSEKRYEDFKEYANKKLSEANFQIQSNDKKHISEIAKLKGVILQSQSKINDLEKTSSSNISKDNISHTSSNSMFAPLKNNFIK